MSNLTDIPKHLRSLYILDQNAANFDITSTICPPLKHNQLLVKVHAVPIHPYDLSKVSQPIKTPIVPGIECSGIVIEAKTEDPFKYLGKKVALLNPEGTLRNYCICNIETVMLLKDNISLDEAACGFLNAVTCVGLVSIAEKYKARAVINTAANSAVGRNIIRMCRQKGIETINIVRSHQRFLELKEMGCNIILNTKFDGFRNELQKMVKSVGASMAFDCVSGGLAIDIAKSLPEGSIIVSYGNLGEEKGVHMSKNEFKKHVVEGFSTISWLGKMQESVREEVFSYVRDNFHELFRPRIEAKYSWKDYAESLIKYKELLNGRKILIVTDGYEQIV